MTRSRQGSITIAGLERRGSYYDEGVTTKASVAVVTDDPAQKNKLKEDLADVFRDQGGDRMLEFTLYMSSFQRAIHKRNSCT